MSSLASGLSSRTKTTRRRWIAIFGVAVLAAFMTKSAEGLIFLPAIAIYAGWRGQLRSLLAERLTWITAACVVLVGVGYMVLREQIDPGDLPGDCQRLPGPRFDRHRRPRWRASVRLPPRDTRTCCGCDRRLADLADRSLADYLPGDLHGGLFDRDHAFGDQGQLVPDTTLSVGGHLRRTRRAGGCRQRGQGYRRAAQARRRGDDSSDGRGGRRGHRASDELPRCPQHRAIDQRQLSVRHLSPWPGSSTLRR